MICFSNKEAPDLKENIDGSGFYLGFIVWGRTLEWPKATSYLGGSGGMLPKKFSK